MMDARDISVWGKMILWAIVVIAFLVGIFISVVTSAEAAPTGPPFNASYYGDRPPNSGSYYSSSYDPNRAYDHYYGNRYSGGYNGYRDSGYYRPEPLLETAIVVGVMAVIAGAILNDRHRGDYRRGYGYSRGSYRHGHSNKGRWR